MKMPNANLNVGGIALGFAAAAIVVILPMWIGGGMFYEGGMYHGRGMMSPGTMWSNGGTSPIFAAFLFVMLAALIGATIAVVHNTVVRKS